MNVQTALRVQSSKADDDWTLATAAVNIWRGRLLHVFAQAEHAVSEALLAMSRDLERGASIKLRHLVGQRFQDLCDALSEEGGFAKDAEAAVVALVGFRNHEALRSVLCHGSSRIALDRQGRWVLIVRVLAFRGRQAERQVHTFEQEDAEALAREVARASQRLCAALSRLPLGQDVLAYGRDPDDRTGP